MPTTIKVFGNVKDVSRFAKRCTVTIKLLNGPISEDPNLIVPTEVVRTTDETGYFEAQLGLGSYTLFIGDDQILFSVTDLDSGDQNIVTLLEEDLSYTRDPYVSNWNGIRQGNIQFLYVAAPKVFSVGTFDSAQDPVTTMEGTQYRYFCTFVTAIGETPASPMVDADLTAEPSGTCVRLTFNILDVTANVTKRRVWRSTTDEFSEFQVIAEIDPALATFDDVLAYGGYPGGVAPVPDKNTTAGAFYASNVQVAQITPEGGVDLPFRVSLPYAATLAFDREATLDLLVVDGLSVPVLRFRKNATNWIVGKYFAGSNNPGIVPNPATGYTGTRVLREDGTWVAPSGGGGSQTPILSNIDYAGYDLTNAARVEAQTLAFYDTVATSYSAIISSVERMDLPFTCPRIQATTGRALGIEFVADGQVAFYLEKLDDALANNGIQFYRPDGTHDFAISVLGGSVVFNVSAGTGNIEFFTPAKFDSGIDVTGDIHCTGKLTSDGGIDPPYVLFDRQTRAEVKARVLKEVPTAKQTGAAQFWNPDTRRMEIYLASEDKFFDLVTGNELTPT
jgi:hypothetical protein